MTYPVPSIQVIAQEQYMDARKTSSRHGVFCRDVVHWLTNEPAE